MIDTVELISSLASLNGRFFHIPNLNDYATKIRTYGHSIEYRLPHSNKLVSYVLYYDNALELFVSMVWTDPAFQRRGYARCLLERLIRETRKDIVLDVHNDNPAISLYKNLGFSVSEQSAEVVRMRLQKRMAIMQPYSFPYLGYFHLLHASHLFVFYDDVHFKRKGWINRNNILLNHDAFLFTIPVLQASQNSLIKDIGLAIDDHWRRAFRRTLSHAYKKAPYYAHIEPLVMSIVCGKYTSVSDFAIASVSHVCHYLGIPIRYELSSVCAPETRCLAKADRLIAITKNQGYSRYVNSPGGTLLYNKDYFKLHGVDLTFIQTDLLPYKQYTDDFVAGLSIIDVLMFNSVEVVKEFIATYKLLG